MKSTDTLTLNRRSFLARATTGGLAAVLTCSAPLVLAQGDSSVPMDVYKDPSCGCCNGWIEHMNESGFAATVYHPTDLNAIKAEHGVAPQMQSCHTGITSDGYVFEGHVPAKFIKRFLASPSAGARGLSVPGMPLGTPGMDFGNDFTPYDVIQLNEDGSVEVYASVETAADQF